MYLNILGFFYHILDFLLDTGICSAIDYLPVFVNRPGPVLFLLHLY